MTSDTGRRRALVIGGTAAVAAIAGIGTGLWRSTDKAISTPATPPPEADSTLWSLRFAKAGGGDLAMASFRGRPLLINFWATWCPPCVREMPEIDRFARQFGPNGWQVLGLAADQDKPVQDFLGRNPVSYPIALAGFEGIALSRSLGNEAGGLPFTLAFDAGGRLKHRHVGESSFELLASWATGR